MVNKNIILWITLYITYIISYGQVFLWDRFLELVFLGQRVNIVLIVVDSFTFPWRMAGLFLIPTNNMVEHLCTYSLTLGILMFSKCFIICYFIVFLIASWCYSSYNSENWVLKRLYFSHINNEYHLKIQNKANQGSASCKQTEQILTLGCLIETSSSDIK